jgi:hypothetical protein
MDYFKKIIGGFLIVFMCSSAVSDPFSNSVNVKYLSAMYAQLQQRYKVAIDQLDSAKKASDAMKKVQNLSQDLVSEYQFITTFSLENEIARIKNDIEGLTMLDNMQGMSMLDKIKVINSEIDRRFSYLPKDKQPSEEEKNKIKGQYADVAALQSLEAAKRTEALNASAGRLNDKNLASSAASSNALVSALLLAEEQRRLKLKIESEQDMRQTDNAFLQYFNQKSKENKQ